MRLVTEHLSIGAKLVQLGSAYQVLPIESRLNLLALVASKLAYLSVVFIVALGWTSSACQCIKNIILKYTKTERKLIWRN